MKRIISLITAFVLIFTAVGVKANDINSLNSKSAILMDGKSGKILFEKNPDEKLPPASITKIMVMLLVMEAIDKGNIKADDIVTVSKDAAIKEGSHIFLAEGEQMTVNDLMKGVAVASGNDAAIALGEYLCGTKDKFIERMNERAKELKMDNTHFVTVNGLDADGHYSSARDIATMTYELLKHPKVFQYTTIWMDTLRNGAFQLANTNKLIRFYKGANGMKTGSTSKAGYCVSATALRNNMQLIAVVLSAPNSKNRFADASTLLNYGFGTYSNIDLCKKGEVNKYIKTKKGVPDVVPAVISSDLSTVAPNGEKDKIKASIKLPEYVPSPIKKGDKIGEIVFKKDNEIVAKSDIVCGEDVKKVTIVYSFTRLFSEFFKINS